MRRTFIALLMGVLLLGSTFKSAAEQADGTVKITGKSIAAGVGFSWGNGVLTYKGKDYPSALVAFRLVTSALLAQNYREKLST